MSKPKINPTRTIIDVLFEAFAFATIVYLVAYLIFNYSYLPEKIPTKYGFGGDPNFLGDKSHTIVLAFIAVALYIVFTVINKYPHILNYPVKITKKNAEIQYRLAKSLNSYIKLFIGVIFLFVQFKIFCHIWGFPSGPDYLAPILIIGGTVIPIVTYIFLSVKYRKIYPQRT